MNHEPSTVDTTSRVRGRTGSRRRARIRRTAFQAAAITLACLPFVLAEIGLRWFSPSPSVIEAIDRDPLVDLHQLRPLFVLDESADQWAIPPSRYNFFRPASFPAQKAPRTRRIFVLGGSTTQGRPYSTETAFSTWLKLRLQADDPEMKYEVINCGGVSYASYRVAKILAEVLQHQPDAIVLYTGHNEYLEDRTYAEVREFSLPRQWASRIGSQLRTIGWLKEQFATESPKQELAAEVDAKLDHAGGLESYQRDPFWRRGVEEHFRVKLNQMIAAVQQAGIPLVLCVPASDWVDTPPIKVQELAAMNPDQASQFRSSYAIASEGASPQAARLLHANKCLVIDPEHAGANYILGRLQFADGQVAEAKRHLIIARDQDVCPLRATTSIIQSVRDASAMQGVLMVDTESLFDDRGPSGQLIPDAIPDPDRFVDHLHPSIAGHQKIAEAIANELAASGWYSAQSDAETAYQTLTAGHLQSLDESYYARGKQRLEGLHRWATGRAESLGSTPLGTTNANP